MLLIYSNCLLHRQVFIIDSYFPYFRASIYTRTSGPDKEPKSVEGVARFKCQDSQYVTHQLQLTLNVCLLHRQVFIIHSYSLYF